MLRRISDFISDLTHQADLVLLGLCGAATVYGLVAITSATNFMGTLRFVIVQAVAALLGIGMYFLTSLIDLTEVVKKWKWIMLFNIGFILLLKTPLGFESNGNLAWLHFPGIPVNIQPAEIVKLTFILLLAQQLVWLREHRDLKSIPSIMMLGGHLLLITGLYYAISSDMGSALVYVFIFGCMAFAAGVAVRWFVLGIGGAGFAFFILWNKNKIPEYMMDRFRTLFDHDMDPLGVGWHQTRGLLTLGGGKLFGQGLFQGTQTQSEMPASLPFRHTDFIFDAIGEELGLMGCLLVIILLVAIIVRCLTTALKAKTEMESYICVGMAAMLIFQTISNIGMCIFVMPVIGLTLPFFSYGGSSILTLYMSMGVVSGIRARSRPEWLR